MHLSSITIKGFKSFPERTRLVFSPGVSVVVGPNGCGKSNITDAVLWALGEQSPLAVRGQTMQDMIFAGGEEQSPRRYAEVEVVLDNSDGAAAGSEFSEISIRRRLERNGDGEYRLNGARCRLVDVIEVLADANLGREMHSVISQGRVEEIVHSKPRDRRLLVEEAAGLGKHRKRRRRAQLKLERTQENLDRALDVEREARSRLRPLKRQAQAADIQARLEREAGELRATAAGGRAPRALERARWRRARSRQGPGGAPARRGGAGEGQPPPDRDRGAPRPARSRADRGLGPADGPASRPRAAQRPRRGAVRPPRPSSRGSSSGVEPRSARSPTRPRRAAPTRATIPWAPGWGGSPRRSRRRARPWSGPGRRTAGACGRPRWRGSARHPSARRTARGGSRSSWVGAGRTRWRAASRAATGLLERLDALLEATAEARAAVGERAAGLERRMLDQHDTDDVTAQLRACSQAEAELQARLHAMGESVTEAEVRATHLRDRRDEAAAELERIAPRLGREIEPASEALSAEERDQIERKLERLARRREALGPVNPLAEQEYSDALAHVGRARGAAAGPGIGARGAPGPDPRHRPQDPGRLRGDLRGDRAKLRGADRAPLPRRPRPPAPGRRARPPPGARGRGHR